MTNDEIADVLERVAVLLAAQRASSFRVRAWRRASELVRTLDRDVSAIVASEGPDGVDRLPGIGPSLAAAIDEIVRTGRLRFLAHLEGDLGPHALFTTLPGIGPELAARIASELDVHTLEELEIAAHDGRLERVGGIGPRRARAIRESLEVTLRGSARRRSLAARDRPSVALLLDVDARYRSLAAADRLPKIAPRRFNPDHRAWLPILHHAQEGWHFTALFSNTARAHELGKSHEWVVIYAEREGREVQFTVVTETRGPLAGQRVVRGREAEPRRNAA